jgi:hypothetical protein
MRTDEIAKRYAFSREGFQLVSYEEVGLPVYRLTLRVLTQVQKPIPPIEEFVLKSLNAGLDTMDQLSGFLGLHEQTLKHTLTNLMRSEDIVLSGRHPQLTPKGRNTLRDSTLIVPDQRTIEVYYDRLLHNTPLYEGYLLLSPKEMRDQERLWIPPSPVRPPQLDDLSFAEINRMMQQERRITKEDKQELIAIKAIEKKTNLFVNAVALKYKSNTDNSIQIGFAIDGRLSEGHENAFAKAGLIKKLGFDRYLPEEVEEIKMLAPVQADETLRQIAIAEQKVQDSENELSIAVRAEEVSQAQRNLAQAKEEHATVNDHLRQIPIRFLAVYEHGPLLERAITKCRQRLLIISPWIKRNVVNWDFIKKLEKLLSQNIDVYVGYGMGRNEDSPDAIRDLKKLAQRYRNFRFKDFSQSGRKTHAKVLLCDQDFVAVSSFNWLSFKGDPARTFRDEQGTLITDPGLIEEKFAEQVVHF